MDVNPTSALISIEKLSDSLAPFRNYFHQANPRSSEGHIWLNMYIGHTKSVENILREMGNYKMTLIDSLRPRSYKLDMSQKNIFFCSFLRRPVFATPRSRHPSLYLATDVCSPWHNFHSKLSVTVLSHYFSLDSARIRHSWFSTLAIPFHPFLVCCAIFIQETFFPPIRYVLFPYIPMALRIGFSNGLHFQTAHP